MRNKKQSTGEVIVKIIIILGALAAIFVAATLICKKYCKKLNCMRDEDEFNFDDEDFLDECDFCEETNCEGCPAFKNDEEEAEPAEEEKTEE